MTADKGGVQVAIVVAAAICAVTDHNWAGVAFAVAFLISLFA